jgi:hypothetical protein
VDAVTFGAVMGSVECVGVDGHAGPIVAYADWHGCRAGFLCRRHYDQHVAYIAADPHTTQHVFLCEDCRKLFSLPVVADYPAWVTVMAFATAN